MFNFFKDHKSGQTLIDSLQSLPNADQDTRRRLGNTLTRVSFQLLHRNKTLSYNDNKTILLLSEKEVAKNNNDVHLKLCETILHVTQTTYNKRKENEFVVPAVISLYEAGRRNLETDLKDHPNIFMMAREITKEYGVKYQLSDKDCIKLGDFLFETADPSEFSNFGQNLTFNNFAEALHNKQDKSREICMHFYNPERSDKVKQMLIRYKQIKMDLAAQETEGKDTPPQQICNWTIKNLTPFVQ
jgi:hypothetical protein